MTVTYLSESASDRRAINELGVRSYTRGFWLTTTSQSEGPYTVGSHASLPDIGSAHPEDSSAWCRRLSVECVAGWRLWKVIAEYSSEYELNTTPTSDPAIITWSTEQFQKPAEFDASGNAVVNSAGDKFDPPALMDDSRRIVTVQKNMSAVPTWILTYQDAVNNDTFSVGGVSIAIGQAKMQSVNVSVRKTRNLTNFYEVTFTMHLQKDGWVLSIVDAGYRKKVGTGREIITNTDKTLPTTPVALDGSGGVLANPTAATIVYRDFTVYETKAFSSLPLT